MEATTTRTARHAVTRHAISDIIEMVEARYEVEAVDTPYTLDFSSTYAALEIGDTIIRVWTQTDRVVVAYGTGDMEHGRATFTADEIAIEAAAVTILHILDRSEDAR